MPSRKPSLTLDQAMKEIEDLRQELDTLTARLYLDEQLLSELRERVDALEGEDSEPPYHL
jgi:hypothetical protein